MRYIFRVIVFASIAFLLLNIAVYLLPTDIETSNAQFASEPEINPDEILFAADSSNRNEAIDIESIPSLNVSDSSGSAKTLSGEQSDDSNVCYRIGPFLRESRVEAVGTQLKELFIGYSLVEREPVTVLANRVFVGPFSDVSQAVAARRQLSNDGINDHFHRGDSGGNYIVSLGIYSKKQSAEEQLEKFREQNIAAQIREEETQLPKNYWLELSRFTPDSKIESVAGISWGESSVSLGKHPCQNSE